MLYYQNETDPFGILYKLIISFLDSNDIIMSEDHVQLDDKSTEVPCCEYKRCLRNLGYSIMFILWMVISYTLGILMNWGLSGISPREMSASDYIASLLFGVIAGMMIVGISISIGTSIYSVVTWCLDRRKMEEVGDKINVEHAQEETV